MTEQPQAMTAKYRQDYQAPLYWCDSLDLDFQLQEPLTRVTAISRLRRNGEHNEPLVLDGEGLVLHSVSVAGVNGVAAASSAFSCREERSTRPMRSALIWLIAVGTSRYVLHLGQLICLPG